MKNGYDLLKVIAILLVVIGHTTNHYTDGFSSLVTKGIYLFHMPLFIAISGAVYELGCQKGKYSEFVPFFKNKVMRLLVPFAFTAICVLAPILYFLGNTGQGFCSIVSEMMLGGAAIKQLWYLQALFEMFVLVWVLRKIRVPMVASYIASLIIAVACSVMSINLGYFSLGMMFQDLTHFIFGILFARYAKFSFRGGGDWKCIDVDSWVCSGADFKSACRQCSSFAFAADNCVCVDCRFGNRLPEAPEAAYFEFHPCK